MIYEYVTSTHDFQDGMLGEVHRWTSDVLMSKAQILASIEPLSSWNHSGIMSIGVDGSEPEPMYETVSRHKNEYRLLLEGEPC